MYGGKYSLCFSFHPDHLILASLPTLFPTARPTPRPDPRGVYPAEERRGARSWTRGEWSRGSGHCQPHTTPVLLTADKDAEALRDKVAGINRGWREDKEYRREPRRLVNASATFSIISWCTFFHPTPLSLCTWAWEPPLCARGRELSSTFTRSR